MIICPDDTYYIYILIYVCMYIRKYGLWLILRQNMIFGFALLKMMGWYEIPANLSRSHGWWLYVSHGFPMFDWPRNGTSSPIILGGSCKRLMVSGWFIGNSDFNKMVAIEATTKRGFDLGLRFLFKKYPAGLNICGAEADLEILIIPFLHTSQ